MATECAPEGAATQFALERVAERTRTLRESAPDYRLDDDMAQQLDNLVANAG